MPNELDVPGWPWTEGSTPRQRRPEIEEAIVACFNGPAGQLVLRHLRRVFVERRVPPTASDAELRHAEGQRTLAAWLISAATRRHGQS